MPKRYKKSILYFLVEYKKKRKFKFLTKTKFVHKTQDFSSKLNKRQSSDAILYPKMVVKRAFITPIK